MSFLIAAISLGFLGSFHCIGMCGPIAMSLPVHREKPARKILLIIIYNSGRILTYFILGLFFGLLGQSVVMAGFQQALSIAIGVLLLLILFVPSEKNRLSAPLMLFFNNVKNKLSKLFLKSGKRSLFLIGLLNGLLPCGLVYIGIAGAIAAGDAFKGGLFMAVFGAGTLPVMLSMPFAGSFISLKIRNNIRKIVPVFIAFTAILLIIRGLNLGIPYMSPKFEKNSSEISCHTQGTDHPKNVIKCSGQNSQHKK